MRISYALSLAFALLLSGADNLRAQDLPPTPSSITFGKIGQGRVEGNQIEITFRFDLKNSVDDKSLPLSSDFRSKARISADGKPLVAGFDPAKTKIYLAGHRVHKPPNVTDVYGLNWNKDRWYPMTNLGDGKFLVTLPIWYMTWYDYQVVISDGASEVWTPDPHQTMTDISEAPKDQYGNSRLFSSPSVSVPTTTTQTTR